MFPAAWARRHARERLDLEADEIDGGHYITLSRRESSPSGLQHTPRAFDDRYEADPAPQRWVSGTVVRAGNERWSTNGAQRCNRWRALVGRTRVRGRSRLTVPG